MISNYGKAALTMLAFAYLTPSHAAEVTRLSLNASGHIPSSTCQAAGFSFGVRVTGTADDSSGQDAVTFRLLDGQGNPISNSFIMLPIGKTFESNILLAVSIKSFGKVFSPQARPFKIEAIESGLPFSMEGAVLASATFDPTSPPTNVSSCAFLPDKAVE